MPRCLICKAENATCGQPTAHKTIGVDEPVRGLKVVGDKLMPDFGSMQATLTDMSDAEREEFQIMSVASQRRSLRQRAQERSMSDGTMANTFLHRVYCVDGITRKMRPTDAEEYVKMYSDQGAQIVERGGLPEPNPNEVIGASKATTGQVFEADGTQIPDAQLLTSRTFHATDRNSRERMAPTPGMAIGEGTGFTLGVNDVAGTTQESSSSDENDPKATPENSGATATTRMRRATVPDDKSAE